MDLQLIYRASCSMILVLISTCHGYSGSPTVRDYCASEAFHPECHNGVLIVEFAYYGRMKLGSCVTQDYGMLGCKSDVTAIFMDECFAKTTCDISIRDDRLFHLSPCGELHSYLEVGHSCLSVISSPKAACETGDILKITAPAIGYFSSLTTKETGCGSQASPWLLESTDGKLITITLLDLTYTGSGDPSQNSICLVYALIKETGRDRSETVCGGQSRERVVYRSISNSIEITIVSQERQFILKYEFTGCADMTIHDGLSASREGNVTTVTCDINGDSSTFRCNETSWAGQLPNCTKQQIPVNEDLDSYVPESDKPLVGDRTNHVETIEAEKEEGDVVSFSYQSITWGMVLIVVGIITGGIVACVFIIAVVYLKRKSIECKAPILVPRPLSEAGYEVCDFDISRRTSSVFHDRYRTVPKDYTPMMNGGTMKYKPPGVWERPLPAELSNV